MAFAVVLLGSVSASAGDWPQILGPNRNGIAEKETLTAHFPESGPKVVWSHSVGNGFAGVAVAEGIAIVFHRVDGFERVEALDAATGKPLWKKDFPTTFQPSYVEDNGPRSVPVIHQKHIYVYGAMGGLRCLELATGNVVWERDTYEDYNSKRPFRGEPPEGYFGIGSTPLVVDDKLIVNVGGDQKDAGVVAFALKDGKTLWKSTRERAGYSSPVLATVDNVRHVICVTRLSVVSLDPANGNVRFQFPFNGPGPKVSAANPVLLGDHFFVTASYSAGAVFAQILPKEAKIVWQSDELLSSQYTTPVAAHGKLIGVHGRQDIGDAVLRCIDPKTQKVLWEKEGLGYATLVAADGKLLILSTEGELILAALETSGYKELARTRISENTIRALPALANGLFYVRDTDTLKCLDLRP
jgi:outer membrane protein assembly factor BamB